MCIYIYICTRIHLSLSIHIYIYIYAHTCYVYIYTYTYIKGSRPTTQNSDHPSLGSQSSRGSAGKNEKPNRTGRTEPNRTVEIRNRPEPDAEPTRTGPSHGASEKRRPNSVGPGKTNFPNRTGSFLVFGLGITDCFSLAEDRWMGNSSRAPWNSGMPEKGTHLFIYI